MPTSRENKCCHNYGKVKEEMGEEVCITDCRTFNINCLDRDVLRVSRYEYAHHNGPYGDEETEHEVYRHLAYRRFCFLIWQKLGRGNRRVIPSCAVLAIRKAFPNPESVAYTGFKPAVSE
ncbi:hypothetical protein KUCAC02_027787 [Chaenocephalus aceratus]|nr:hypothetical protein KUCAC02_027787 [Chaenocephalus aceratus]